MGDWSSLGKLLLSVALILTSVGIFFLVVGKILNIGKLPGDILYQKDNFTFFFPIVTSIIISIVVTIIINFFYR